MKSYIKLFSIFAAFIIAVSCATAPKSLPEKYNLDSELEPVDRITSYKDTSWEQLDKQSVLLYANWDEHYLLILNRPIDIAPLTIGISGTGPSITAGHDRVEVNDSASTQYYYIDKIYKIKDREQLKKIKDRFKKKRK